MRHPWMLRIGRSSTKTAVNAVLEQSQGKKRRGKHRELAKTVLLTSPVTPN